MTDRERLIELLAKSSQKCDSTDCNRCKYWNTNDCGAARIADKILSDGWIRPPCKVGDTVYAYCDTFYVVLPYVVTSSHTSYMGKGNKDFLYWEGACFDDEKNDLLDDIEFELNDIGKTVFLTREEAEKALAERECATNAGDS